MLVKDGTISYGSTGTKSTIVCGFQPDEIDFRVSGLYGGGDTDAHFSLGKYIAGATIPQHVDSVFNDTTNSESISDDTKVIKHLEWNGSAVSPVIEATVNSVSATGFALNLTQASAAYNIYFVARKY